MTVEYRRASASARERRLVSWFARNRAGAQSWPVFVLVGILLIGMLAALASGLSESQLRSRRGLEERFADQATTRAELTNALVRSSIASDRAQNATLYGAAHVSPAALTAAATEGHSADLVLIARDGTVLAASAGTPAPFARAIGARPAYIRDALRGTAFSLSSVSSLGRRGAVVQLAEGFDSAYGKRVLVTGFAPTALSASIGGYLVSGADAHGGQRAYVIDENGAIIASAPVTGAPAPHGPAIEPGLLSAVHRGERGHFGADAYFVASTIPDSRWRVVLVEPAATLYASVSGFGAWVPWILFVTLALMSSAALLLVGRIVRAAAKARRNDERLRTAIDERLQLAGIVESSDDAIIGQTLGGRIISWNRGAEKLYGYEPGEIVGTSVTTLIPSDRMDELAATMERINADKVDHRQTVRLGRGGRAIDVALTISPVYNASGELTGAATIARDITERKRIEADLVLARDQALDASRSKSEFVANMSHEIRTPLNGVIGMTDLLRDTPLDPVQREYLNALASSSEALLAVINDILDFSKMEAGRLELDPVDFELRGAIEEACLMLAKQAHAKGLEINHWVDADLPAAVTGDRARLRQVLLNLLANAVKFTDSGEVVLRVSRAESERVRFAVLDTGVGIDDTRATSLFEAFVQADLSSSRRHGGTGLGLAISRQLVERMGGEIGARAREDGGSEFWFTAQLVPARAPIDSAPARPELIGRRVLVVDNNPTNRTILERYLSDWGLSCETTDLPASALAKLEGAVASGHPFELAVLDYKMPEMNGIELAHAIRERPALSTVKLLMLSSAVVDRDSLTPAGILRLLSKPARQAELYQAIADAVSGIGRRDAPQRGPEGLPDPGGPIVLVAEDNEVNRAVAKALLAKRNLRTETAANGKEALRMSQAREYAAILMDCQMPELDGYEATRRIRELETDRHTPIIAMTAHSMAGDRERCLAAGMDDYLSKPVRANELDAAIERWLPGHKWGSAAGAPHGETDADSLSAGSDAVRDGSLRQKPASRKRARVVSTGRTDNGDEPSSSDGAAGDRQADELLDARTVGTLRETLTPEMRSHLMSKFEESLPKVLAEIEQAVHDHDTVALRRSAHLLKGSSATLGADRLRRVCLRLEQTRAGDDGVGETALDELRAVASETGEALHAQLVEPAAPASATPARTTPARATPARATPASRGS
jgi:two-component system, sensor histidine kinase and response regulator